MACSRHDLDLHSDKESETVAEGMEKSRGKEEESGYEILVPAMAPGNSAEEVWVLLGRSMGDLTIGKDNLKGDTGMLEKTPLVAA